MWYVVVCDLENLVNEKAVTSVGSQRHSKIKQNDFFCQIAKQAKTNPKLQNLKIQFAKKSKKPKLHSRNR
jgi:hypothetical protein